MCYIRSLGKGAFRIVARGQVRWLEYGILARFPWLVHAFSTRAGGTSRGTPRGLNLGFIEADSRKNVERNRRRFLRSLGANSFLLAALRQVHSTNIFRASAQQSARIEFTPVGGPDPEENTGGPPAGDALITDQPGFLLSIRTADCLPVLIVDPRRRAVAALHAGWRGALGRIAEKVVGAMRGIFGSQPRDLCAVVGPGIQACCYAVGDEVVSAFRGRFVRSEQFFKPVPASSEATALTAKYPNLFLSPYPPGHEPQHRPAAHLDLAAAVRDQLSTAGLRRNRISCMELCTACRTDLFFSHRKEGARTGRMMAVIGLKPEAND